MFLFRIWSVHAPHLEAQILTKCQKVSKMSKIGPNGFVVAVFRVFKPLIIQYRQESHLDVQLFRKTYVDSFCQIWYSESTSELYNSFSLRQNNRSRTNSKFRDSCQH
jgi:hypothetical protein